MESPVVPIEPRSVETEIHESAHSEESIQRSPLRTKNSEEFVEELIKKKIKKKKGAKEKEEEEAMLRMAKEKEEEEVMEEGLTWKVMKEELTEEKMSRKVKEEEEEVMEAELHFSFMEVELSQLTEEEMLRMSKEKEAIDNTRFSTVMLRMAQKDEPMLSLEKVEAGAGGDGGRPMEVEVKEDEDGVEEEEEDDEEEEEYKDYGKYETLRRAAVDEDWHVVKNFIDDHPEALTEELLDSFETILHYVVKSENIIEFVRELVAKMPEEALELTDMRDMTALSYCAAYGNTEAAKIMVQKNHKLLNIPDKWGNLPLHHAARFGHKDTVDFL